MGIRKHIGGAGREGSAAVCGLSGPPPGPLIAGFSKEPFSGTAFEVVIDKARGIPSPVLLLTGIPMPVLLLNRFSGLLRSFVLDLIQLLRIQT